MPTSTERLGGLTAHMHRWDIPTTGAWRLECRRLLKPQEQQHHMPLHVPTHLDLRLHFLERHRKARLQDDASADRCLEKSSVGSTPALTHKGISRSVSFHMAVGQTLLTCKCVQVCRCLKMCRCACPEVRMLALLFKGHGRLGSL